MPFRNTYDHQIWETSNLHWRITPSKSPDILITWSRDKLKNLYLHFHNNYGHQTWQSSCLRLGDPNCKVTWSFNNLVTWQIKKTYICSSIIPMITKFGRLVTCSGGPHLQFNVTFWLRGHVTNSKNLYLQFHNTYGNQTWQGGSLPSEDLTYVVRWPFDQVITWQF